MLAVLVTGALHGAARAEEAFVTDQDGDAVTVIDLAARKGVATIHVDGKPAGIAMTRDGTRAFVTSPSMQMVSVIDTRACRRASSQCRPACHRHEWSQHPCGRPDR
jgi:YVTN family beta-propeller protein